MEEMGLWIVAHFMIKVVVFGMKWTILGLDYNLKFFEVNRDVYYSWTLVKRKKKTFHGCFLSKINKVPFDGDNN